ncbi:hypothetical protein B7494_g3463 [Chlorociboria aeruginascens]|nr:hypothetical protein B7494_g3463 [Chlorociboria aeruginascens]
MLPPSVHAEPAEALFAVVVSELNNSTRHSSSHLDFTNPVLKSVDNLLLEGEKLVTLEKMIEDKYLKSCNPENLLHFVNMWTARGYLAKTYLIEHYSRSSKAPLQQSAISHALRMVECNTKLLAFPLTKNYLWLLLYMQFPFPAYLHTRQELRWPPTAEYATRTREVLGDNYEVRFTNIVEKLTHSS